MVIRIKAVRDGAIAPSKGTSESNCFDLYGLENRMIGPGEVVKIPTGWTFDFTAGFGAEVWPRSGMALKKRLEATLAQIDTDYRGELFIALKNVGEEVQSVKKGDRIAQLKIFKIENVSFLETDGSLGETDRGSNGFGSSGQ